MPVADRVLALMRETGGVISMGELERKLDLHKNTVRKRLQELIADGIIESEVRGRYRLPEKRQLAVESSQQLLSVLEDGAFEAHITGFDLLTAYAHQFVFDYPHLVYVEPSSFEALEFELPKHDFVVVPAGPGPKPSSSDQARLAVLRRQPNAEQYGVRGHLAPPEKAWVDTLRETLRGNLPFSPLELGRILRNLVDAGANMRYLRRYARLLGYLDRVDAALSQAEPKSPEAAALRAGFQA